MRSHWKKEELRGRSLMPVLSLPPSSSLSLYFSLSLPLPLALHYALPRADDEAASETINLASGPFCALSIDLGTSDHHRQLPLRLLTTVGLDWIWMSCEHGFIWFRLKVWNREGIQLGILQIM